MFKKFTWMICQPVRIFEKREMRIVWWEQSYVRKRSLEGNVGVWRSCRCMGKSVCVCKKEVRRCWTDSLEFIFGALWRYEVVRHVARIQCFMSLDLLKTDRILEAWERFGPNLWLMEIHDAGSTYLRLCCFTLRKTRPLEEGLRLFEPCWKLEDGHWLLFIYGDH